MWVQPTLPWCPRDSFCAEAIKHPGATRVLECSAPPDSGGGIRRQRRGYRKEHHQWGTDSSGKDEVSQRDAAISMGGGQEETTRTGVQNEVFNPFSICHFPAMWPWTSVQTSLSLGFLNYKKVTCRILLKKVSYPLVALRMHIANLQLLGAHLTKGPAAPPWNPAKHLHWGNTTRGLYPVPDMVAILRWPVPTWQWATSDDHLGLKDCPAALLNSLHSWWYKEGAFTPCLPSLFHWGLDLHHSLVGLSTLLGSPAHFP